MYRVEYHRDAATELRQIARGDAKRAKRIADVVRSLASEPRPRGCEQLAPSRYRIRQGGYRILYRVFDDVVLVVVMAIDRRGEVYGKKNTRGL